MIYWFCDNQADGKLTTFTTAREHRYRYSQTSSSSSSSCWNTFVSTQCTTSHSDGFGCFNACGIGNRCLAMFSLKTKAPNADTANTHSTHLPHIQTRSCAQKYRRAKKKANAKTATTTTTTATAKKWAETKIPEFWNSKKPVFISTFGHSMFVRLRSRLKLFLHAVTRCQYVYIYVYERLCWTLLVSLSHTSAVFVWQFKYCL